VCNICIEVCVYYVRVCLCFLLVLVYMAVLRIIVCARRNLIDLKACRVCSVCVSVCVNKGWVYDSVCAS